MRLPAPDACAPHAVWLVVWMAGSIGFLIGTSGTSSLVFLPPFLEQCACGAGLLPDQPAVATALASTRSSELLRLEPPG
jgi:hypothetical protein